MKRIIVFVMKLSLLLVMTITIGLVAPVAVASSLIENMSIWFIVFIFVGFWAVASLLVTYYLLWNLLHQTKEFRNILQKNRKRV